MIHTRIKPPIESGNNHNQMFSPITPYQEKKTQEINLQNRDPPQILYSQKNLQPNLIKIGPLT